jgi:hypothetical protein
MNMPTFKRNLIGLFLCAISAFSVASPLVITGATLVDVSDGGRGQNDISPATVILDGDRIAYAGPAATAPIPAGAQTINAAGKYLVPGLIEGFGSLQSQGFANAYLYEGVTSVYLADPGRDSRRGIAYLDAKPSPRVMLGAAVTGYSEDGQDDSDESMARQRVEGKRLSHEQLSARLEALKAKGVRCVLIHYNTWPDQVDHIVREARRLGLGTIGELGFTDYAYAARAGVGAFVHGQKYHGELAPFDVRLAWADDPFGPPATVMNLAIWEMDPESDLVRRWGRFLAQSNTYLMPTEMLAVNSFVGYPRHNPWLRPSAALVADDQLFRPLDRRTAEPPPSTRPADYVAKGPKGVKTEMRMDRSLHEQGARFLAASGTSAFGVLPGGGLHEEMRLLVDEVGLTPREALAAATSNYAAALHFDDVGEIRAGRRADLLILTADPRHTIDALETIDTVIAQGQVVDRAALLNWQIPAVHPKYTDHN